MHVGVDTVGLAGEGFHVHVRKGDRVRAGDLLLTFDLELLAGRVPSLMTPIIVTNADRFRISQVNTGRMVASRRRVVRGRKVRGWGGGHVAEPVAATPK